MRRSRRGSRRDCFLPIPLHGSCSELRCAGGAREAVRALRAGVRAAPSQADLHWQLGDAREAAGARLDALRSCRAAIRLRPDHAEAYASLARVAAYETRSSRAALLARWAFRAALRLQPVQPVTLHNLGEYLEAQSESIGAARSFGLAARCAVELPAPAQPGRDAAAAVPDGRGARRVPAGGAPRAAQLARAGARAP